MSGYNGRLLAVDLTTGQIQDEQLRITCADGQVLVFNARASGR